MLPQCKPADVASPGLEGVGPIAGWDLIQYDWGMRQSEQGEPIAPRSCPIARLLAAPIAAVHALLRSRARC